MKISTSANKILRIATRFSWVSAATLILAMVLETFFGFGWQPICAVSAVTALAQLCFALTASGNNLEWVLAWLRDVGAISLEDPLLGEQAVLRNAVPYSGSLLTDAPRALVELCLGRQISEAEDLAAPLFVDGYSQPGDGSVSALLMRGGRVWHFRFNLGLGPKAWIPVVTSGTVRELDSADIVALAAA